MNQKTTDPNWIDENGQAIPVKRITKCEKLMEQKSTSLLKGSKSINQHLIGFKKDIKAICEEVEKASLAENGVVKENSKGNLTWYNFDRSIKVERSVSEPVKFDELTISAAKAKLDEFLNEAIESKFNFAKDMILTAFETTKGQLDPKKITPLTRYESKVNHPLFTEACKLIQQALRRPDSKTYYRIWAKDADGKYQAVELNFSNI
jgi:hypothetical protein